MVSWDTCISGRSGYSRANHAEICSGDHLASSLRSTTPRSRRHWASLARLGRNPRRHAARSATRARYFLLPPLALTSRYTVEGERPRDWAMARMESPAASPLEISSRSLRDNRSSERCRAVGRFPPASAMNLRNDTFCLPRCLAMRLTGTPASRMSQIVWRSSSLKRLHICIPPDRWNQCPPIRLVLQRPLEDTGDRGHGHTRARDQRADCHRPWLSASAWATDSSCYWHRVDYASPRLRAIFSISATSSSSLRII